MEYKKEDNIYTESHREGQMITIYYKDNEIILKNEYNILIDKHNISIKNAFRRCEFSYVTDLYFQLDEHLDQLFGYKNQRIQSFRINPSSFAPVSNFPRSHPELL